MPASTFEIIAKQWEDEVEVFKKIAIASKKADLYFLYYKENIEIRVEPSSEKSLVIEIQTQKSVDWYYNLYPAAREEPEERVPYFLFDKSKGNEKFYVVAMANNYLDDLLIWKFSVSYLKDNPDHIITLNRNVFLDLEKVNRIKQLTGYIAGWCFNLERILNN